MFFVYLWFSLPDIPICLILSAFFWGGVWSVCQLTLWNSSFDDGEVGREAFLCNGAVGVDCQGQDACVRDDPARGVLPAVPSDMWANWREKKRE